MGTQHQKTDSSGNWSENVRRAAHRLSTLFVVAALVVVGIAGGASTEASAQRSAAARATPTATPANTAAYTMTDLGSLGYGVTRAGAINNNGQVTGYSYLSTAFQVTCPPQKYGQPKQCFEHPYHAFLWSSGTMTDLGTLGGHFSRGYAINLSGTVVGTADTKIGGDSFLWNGKTMSDIGSWSADGINDLGQISGTCGPNPGLHACMYSSGKLSQLPDPGTFTPINCGGGQINQSGQVVGTCDDTSSYTHGVLWTNGTPTDLGTLGGPQTGAQGLNNLGQVVGWSQTSTDAAQGFLWSNGKMTDLGFSWVPAAINDNGVIVGSSMIYSNGTVRDLNNLIPPGSGFTLSDATAINDSGQIVVDGSNAIGQDHAFLLTPK